jgi:hypothetical protein
MSNERGYRHNRACCAALLPACAILLGGNAGATHLNVRLARIYDRWTRMK